MTLVIGIFNKRPLHLVNWLEQVIISPYCYCLNYSLKQEPFNDLVTRETSFSFPWRMWHWMRRDCSFLIHFTQTKITSFIFWNNCAIKQNECFLLVEPCSPVTCCVEIQLQCFFRKYILICTIYTLLLLLLLILVILYDTCKVHGGSNSWEKPMASGAKMEQWSVNFVYRKTKSCRQHSLYVLGLTFLE